jgi:hypothetical protein
MTNCAVTRSRRSNKAWWRSAMRTRPFILNIEGKWRYEMGARTDSSSNRTAKYAEARLGRHVAYLLG